MGVYIFVVYVGKIKINLFKMINFYDMVIKDFISLIDRGFFFNFY